MTRVTVAHLEARKESILDSALKVFARRGIQFATMAEIAEEAGISAGAIYRYFPGKEALIDACFSENTEQITSEWHREVEAAEGNPLDALFNIARTSVAHLYGDGAEDRTRVMAERILDGSRMDDEKWRADASRERDAIAHGLAEPIELAQAGGTFPASIDAYQLSQALLSFYNGARLGRLIGPEMDPMAQLEALCSLVSIASEAAREKTAAQREFASA